MQTQNGTFAHLNHSLRRWLALAAFVAVVPGLFGASIPNPSFEANSFGAFPGYVNQGGNGTINDWTASGGAGLNPAGGSPFADNGTIPNGGQIAFIQNGAAASLSTTISGLTAGTAYKVNFRVNARSGNTPNLKVDIDAVNIINTAVTSVGGANPYKYFAFDFTASAASQILTLRNDAGGDNTVVIDDFSIETRNSGWSYSAWNDDATSGVDGSKSYTHAYSFGAAVNTVINGITFTGVDGGNPSSAAFSTAGLPNVFPGDANNVTGGSRQLANDFLYNGFPASITINGLIPGTLYVATIYSVGWENGTRAATFSVGNDRLTVNQDHFGDNNGIRVSYRYVATATSITLTYTPLEGNSIHTYGFSNYEFGPPQIANPSFEANTFANFPGYVSGNGPITGWNALGGHGVNPGTFGGPFTDNGAIPNGTKAAFLQQDGALSQLISGFVPGASYRITYAENARTGGTSPFNEVKIGGVTIVAPHAVNPVGGANPYHQVTSDAFTATSTELLLEFIKINPQGGDTTLLIDHVGIVLPNTPVTIALQPQSQSAGVGDNVTFSVVAGGSAPISYQWRKGMSDLMGQNGPTLTLNSVTLGDAGNYSVHVSNLFGMADSAVASLVVRSVVAGLFNTGVDDFGVALADGSEDPHYKLVVNPDGASSIALVEDSTVFPIVAGPWLANNAGSKWIGPRLNTDAAAIGDYTYRLNVDLTGFDPSTVTISGDWTTDNAGPDILVNGVSSGQSNPGNFGALAAFTLNSGFLAGINAIEFKVNNAGPVVGYTGLRVNRIRGLADALPAGTAPFIVTQPQDVLAGINDTVTLSVRANGSAPLNYQWFFGPDPLPGENGPTFSVLIEFPDQAGDYSVEVSNGFDSVHSAAARVEVTVAPLISTDPQNRFVAAGDSVTFTVVARGIEPFTYQWCRGANPILGATDATLTLNGVTDADAGQYSVKVSNEFGTTPSGAATLTVGLPIPGVFNTGVDDFGDALADIMVDSHYRLVVNADGPSPDAIVQDSTAFPIATGPWVANNAGSKWVGPRFNTAGAAGLAQGNGTYTYRLTFDLTGLDPATARISGVWATDNFGIDILVNGQSTGQANGAQFVAFTPFTVTNGFVSGLNTIDFTVQNVDAVAGYTGLRVDQIRGIAAKALTVGITGITGATNGNELEACAPATIHAEVSPASASAPVVRVEFFANGVIPIGSDDSAPYETTVVAAPPGVYTLTAVATDTRGIRATSVPVLVSVVDRAPQITCPSDVSVECTGGLTPVTFTVTATDLCDGLVPVTCTPPSGTDFRIGTSNVVCRATDSSGNVSTCNFVVTVVDTTAPQVVCPSDISVDTTDTAGQIATFPASASDPCGIASFGCQPPSGSLFPLGTTTVTCRATDGAGNPGACSFTVVVTLRNRAPLCQIEIGPLLKLTPDVTECVLHSCNNEDADVILDGSLATDPDGDTLTHVWLLDGVPFATGALATNVLEVGTHTITLVVSDGRLDSTCIKTVTVMDSCEAVEEVVLLVEQSTVTRKNKKPLLEALKNACKEYNKDKCKDGNKKLESFQDKVRQNLRKGDIDATTANRLINAAQAILDGCPDCTKKRPKHKTPTKAPTKRPTRNQ